MRYVKVYLKTGTSLNFTGLKNKDDVINAQTLIHKQYFYLSKT